MVLSMPVCEFVLIMAFELALLVPDCDVTMIGRRDDLQVGTSNSSSEIGFDFVSNQWGPCGLQVCDVNYIYEGQTLRLP